MDNNGLLSIKNYEGFYSIDEQGNVFSIRQKKYLKYAISNGYRQISLCTNNKIKRYNVHRLVAETFIARDESLNLQVNHIDGNKQNNNVNNLEWVTQSENQKHAYKTGLKRTFKGIKKGPMRKNRSIKNQDDIIDIKCKFFMGWTMRELAEDYNTVIQIINEAIYKK